MTAKRTIQFKSVDKDMECMIDDENCCVYIGDINDENGIPRVIRFAFDDWKEIAKFIDDELKISTEKKEQ